MEEKEHAVQQVTRLLRTSRVVDDSVLQRELKDAMTDTSNSLLRWAEAAAAPSDKRKTVPTEILLRAFCGYMEALATTIPDRFASDCQSLAPPVAAVLLRIVPPYPDSSESSPEMAVDDDGVGPDSPEKAEASITLRSPGGESKDRKSLELWTEMLGICLLPFCGPASEDGYRSVGRGGAEREMRRDFEGSDDDCDYIGEEDDADENAAEWVGLGRVGWWALQRARGAGVEPPECPFDLYPGGGQEDLPCRLASIVSSLVKTAVAVSHMASVSSLTAVLAILCAFSATNRCSLEVHEQVLKKAFLCLISITGTAPDTSAQAECIKAALVSLRECIQAARLPALEGWMPSLLSMLEGVPSRLKKLLIRCKSQGSKPYTTARLFCRETLAAAVACARALIGRAGAPAITADPHWFLEDFVVAMASPLLLGDAVRALHAASEGNPSREVEEGQGTRVLRNVVLPGAVERITKALAGLGRYSAGAAKEVLGATAYLAQAASGEILPYRNRLGLAVVQCLISNVQSSSGAEADEKLRLGLRAIRRLVSISSGDAKGSSGVSQPFAEASLDLLCSFVEKEWICDAGKQGSRDDLGDESETGDGGQSMVVVLEAHAALVALLRSDLRCPGVDPNGKWPLAAKRLARVACAFADRVEVAAGSSHLSTLADDDVLLLCQGAEVLEALADCSSVFFRGHEQLLFFSGELSQVLTTVRAAAKDGDGHGTMLHSVVLEACAWVSRYPPLEV